MMEQKVQARLKRAAAALKAAQQQKCEAVFEFLAALKATQECRATDERTPKEKNPCRTKTNGSGGSSPPCA